MTLADVLRTFPRLQNDPRFLVTSPETTRYNCAAWAAHDNAKWWWPVQLGGYYWPAAAPRLTTVAAFITAYETVGFEPCADGSSESGFEKIAIFVDASDKPTHVARQLPSGEWTSKLGNLEDVSHSSPREVEGQVYGRAFQYLRRPSDAHKFADGASLWKRIVASLSWRTSHRPQ